MTGSPSMTSVPGLFNFRDLGGYPTPAGPVQRGRVWRSNAMTQLGDAERSRLADAEITSVVDIREEVEAAVEPVDLAGSEINVISLPLINGQLERHEQSIPEFFYATFRRRGRRIAEIVSLLGSPRYHPVAFFCSTGKDRTGLVSAVVLSAVGVSDEDVATDFNLTEQRLPPSAVEQALARGERIGIPAETSARNMAAPREMMLEVMAELRASHGGAAEFLLAHGLAKQDLIALRRGLLDP